MALVLLLSRSFYMYTLLGASVKKTDGTLSGTIVHLRCYVSFFLLFCRCSVLVFILLNAINKLINCMSVLTVVGSSTLHTSGHIVRA